MTGMLSTPMSRTQPGAPVWGLISDVHGNLPALERAISLLSAAGADRLAFLGDYLGRGDSDACAAVIRSVADVAIVGNRDLDWQDRVSPSTKEWVRSLSRMERRGALLVTHGDSRLTPGLSTAEINRGFVSASTELARADATVWAFGHSHFARIWRKCAGTVEQLADAVAALEDGAVYFVNVGTAGLPFPGKGGPSVALVDFKSATVRHLALESQPR
jgi:predicted phosphodiesterase